MLAHGFQTLAPFFAAGRVLAPMASNLPDAGRLVPYAEQVDPRLCGGDLGGQIPGKIEVVGAATRFGKAKRLAVLEGKFYRVIDAPVFVVIVCVERAVIRNA